jgi:uncharacterized NAD(P)/FAD-binding protein YdhS
MKCSLSIRIFEKNDEPIGRGLPYKRNQSSLNMMNSALAECGIMGSENERHALEWF